MSKRVKTGLPSFSGGIMAPFIRPEDQLPVYLAISVYNPVRLQNIFGYDYSECWSTDRISVYTAAAQAIISFKGTSSAGDFEDDLIIATQEVSCELTLVREGSKIIESLYQQGYAITVAGHSLGGKAAMCIGSMPQVSRVVAINAGTPGINPAPGPGKGIHYHIVGDLISTHARDMEVVRVLFTNKEIDWLSPWAHYTDRFFDKSPFRFITPQEEQDMLTESLLFKQQSKVLWLSLLTSLVGTNVMQLAYVISCENPIPGAVVNEEMCRRKNSIDTIQRVAASIAFGTIGLAVEGPLGLVSGIKAGYSLASGDIRSFIGLIIPFYKQATEVFRQTMKAFLESVETRRDFKEDPIGVITEFFKNFANSKSLNTNQVVPTETNYEQDATQNLLANLGFSRDNLMELAPLTPISV